MQIGFASPPALRVSECARYMGVSSAWIRTAIQEGMRVHGQVVKLDAEEIKSPGRRTYRIYEDRFAEFLRAYGWTRIPGSSPPIRALPQSKGA